MDEKTRKVVLYNAKDNSSYEAVLDSGQHVVFGRLNHRKIPNFVMFECSSQKINEKISRYQFTVFNQNGRLTIQDGYLLGRSKYGTSVNETRIDPYGRLRNNDSIEIGDNGCYGLEVKVLRRKR